MLRGEEEDADSVAEGGDAAAVDFVVGPFLDLARLRVVVDEAGVGGLVFVGLQLFGGEGFEVGGVLLGGLDSVVVLGGGD